MTNVPIGSPGLGPRPRVVIAAVPLVAIRPLDAPSMMMMTGEGMIGLLVTRTGIVDELAMMIEIEETETTTKTDLADTAMMDIAAARLIPDTIVTVTVIAILIGVVGTIDFVPSEPTPLYITN